MIGRAASRAETRRHGKRNAASPAAPDKRWLSRTLEAQKAGLLHEAEKLCRQALQHNPEQPDACYLLAQNLSQRGELREAVVMAARAASGRPAEPMFHLALGDILRARSEDAAALLCYRQALALKPDFLPALVNLGNTLQRTGRYVEAQISYRRAIQVDPGCAEVYDNLGNALRSEGHTEEALACHAEALRQRPGYAPALVNMAATLLSLGRYAEAERAARRAFDIAPGVPEAASNLAVALQKQGRLVEAEQGLREAIERLPQRAYFCINLANVLLDGKRPDEAEGWCRRALEIEPGSAEAYFNLACSLRRLDRYQEAWQAYQSALARRPDYAEAWAEMGTLRLSERRHREALACFDEALRRKPDLPIAHLDRAIALLAEGEIAEGWKEYEWRLKCFDRPPRGLAYPAWRGEPAEGKTVLLFAEQGLGDTIQFVRYAEMVAAHGARVVVDAQPRLTSLLARARGVEAVVSREEELPRFDLAAPLLSLPRVFGTTPDRIPAHVPYLWAAPDKVAAWRSRLGKRNGVRVGLCWRGNPDHSYDRYRSTTLAALEEPARLPQVEWISLQLGALARPEAERAGWLRQVLPDDSDIEDLAAVMEILDVVVSVDSMPAHLAGALGRPCLVLLSYAADWRWQSEAQTSGWYPTLRLFRQKQPLDWSAPVAELAETLRAWPVQAKPGVADMNG
jgi:tetratricopeptide (TPR) repeat protein